MKLGRQPRSIVLIKIGGGIDENALIILFFHFCNLSVPMYLSFTVVSYKFVC
jgi:hypothetical protein